jgi:uncharacterized protein (TIGR03000 family)
MRSLITRVGSIALVAAVALAFVPEALAQRGARFGTSNYGGYRPGFYGVSPLGYPYGGSGVGLGLGYGNAGNYGRFPGSYGYYGNPGYSSSPGNPYYSTPGYYGTPSGMVGMQAYPNAMSGMGPNAQSQSMYAPAANAAQITVMLPPDAQLWIDSQQSTQTGPMRQIVTPATLESGKTYHYTLKAQWTENGQPVVREKPVDFQAGSQVTVDLTKPQQ